MTYKRARAQSASTPIRVNGRTVSRVRDGVNYKNLHTNHFLRIPPAICFERSSLDDIEAAGGRSCYFLHIETGDEYCIDMKTVRQYAFPVPRFSDQIGVPLSRWSINGAQPEADRTAEARQKQAQAVGLAQLSLFGGAA